MSRQLGNIQEKCHLVVDDLVKASFFMILLFLGLLNITKNSNLWNCAYIDFTLRKFL